MATRREVAIAWLRIVRPPIVFISVLGSVACLYLSDPDVTWWTVLLVVLTAALLAMGLMVSNDATDARSDAVCRPDKPIPSGRIDVERALLVGALMLAAAAYATSPLGVLSMAFIGSIVISGLWYNCIGKARGHLFGNIVTAYGVAGIIAYPMVVTGRWHLWPLWMGVFLQEVWREVAVCAGDYDGDKKAGFRTWPVVVGRVRSMDSTVWLLAVAAPFFWYASMTTPALDNIAYTLTWAGWLAAQGIGYVVCRRACMHASRTEAFDAFERWFRQGSRAGVVALQVVLFVSSLGMLA